MRTNKKILVSVFCFFVVMSSLVLSKFLLQKKYNFEDNQTLRLGEAESDTRYIFEHPDFSDSLNSITIEAIPVEPMDYVTRVRFHFNDGIYERYYLGGVYNAYIINDIGLGPSKLVIALGEGQDVETFILEFNGLKNSVKEIKFIDKNKTIEDSLCCNFMLLIPKDNGVQYDVGMPEFINGHTKIDKYDFDFNQHAFIEQ